MAGIATIFLLFPSQRLKAAAAPPFKSAFKAEREKDKKELYQQYTTPVIRKGKAFLKAPRGFQLMPHWSELCHMPSLAARESGK